MYNGSVQFEAQNLQIAPQTIIPQKISGEDPQTPYFLSAVVVPPLPQQKILHETLQCHVICHFLLASTLCFDKLVIELASTVLIRFKATLKNNYTEFICC